MISIDLQNEQHSLEELLALASSDSLIIHCKDGKNFILEEADDFEEEVEKLGKSDKFLAFLGERSKEKETIPIQDVASKLGIKTE